MDHILPYIPYITALSGFLIGVIATWVVFRYRTNADRARSEERLKSADKSIADLEAGSAHLEAELQKVRQSESSMLRRQGELEGTARAARRATEEKQALVEEAERHLAQTFEALSKNALKSSQEEFVRYARSAVEAEQQRATKALDQRHTEVETIVKPVAESLEKVQSRIAELEKAREGAYSSLQEQVRQMTELQNGLRKETGELATALRQPAGRGRWGEMQLRRVIELAGMQEHCDFTAPKDRKGAGDGPAGPDLIVNIPGGQQVVIDARVPMDAYLSALEADDEGGRQVALTRHARQIADHIRELGSDSYRSPFEIAPEFVVLFFPSESSFSGALMQDPSLIEKGVDQGVILATPTTLIALLRAVALGWRQDAITSNARAISEVGRELYDRVTTMTDHFARVGRSLDTTVRNYNKVVGSIETSVLPGARRLEELGTAPPEAKLPGVHAVAHHPRAPHGLSSLPVSHEGVLGNSSLSQQLADDDFEGFAPVEPDGTPRINFAGAGKPDGDAQGAAGDLRAAVDETVVRTR